MDVASRRLRRALDQPCGPLSLGAVAWGFQRVQTVRGSACLCNFGLPALLCSHARGVTDILR